MANRMGLQMGLEGDGRFCKRQFRWMFTVDKIIGDEDSNGSLQCLPPEKSARPSLAFKEMNVQHLIEEVFYPTKPDWKPITVTVFDLDLYNHPIWAWINEFYFVSESREILNVPNAKQGPLEGFIRQCTLKLFDGCGETVETWVYDDCWPQSVNFQPLDMTQNGLCMCDITLRYARAYIKKN